MIDMTGFAEILGDKLQEGKSIAGDLVRTERRAHAEMIPTTIGEILLQKGGISL